MSWVGKNYKRLTSFVVFNLRLQIATGVTRIIWVSEGEGLKHPRPFGPVP